MTIVKRHLFIVCVACTCGDFDAMSAVVVADQESLSIPGAPDTGGFTKFLDLNDDVYALLSNQGVIEVDSNFRQLRAFKFDHEYRYGRQFVRIKDKLYIVGQVNRYRFFSERNDIHLLRYGDSSPLRSWKCGSRCLHPIIVNFFDYENPILIWKDLPKRRQHIRVVQLGTDREWRLDSSGFEPNIRRIGSWDKSKGLQDVFIDLRAYERRWPRAPKLAGVKTIRLSELNLLEESPKHLNEYDGVPYREPFESPSSGYQSPAIPTVPASISRSHFYGDPKAREARISIHTPEKMELPHDDEDAHLWWKVKTQYGVKEHYRTYLPHELNCRATSGEPFDSYLLVAIGGICWDQCGSTIYELRPGGLWREVYHTPVNQHSFKVDLNRKDHFYMIFTGHIIRLDRGVDYCVEDLEQFRHSLP